MNLQKLIERYISHRRALGEKFDSAAAILRAFVRTVGSQADVGGVRAEQIAVFLAGTGPITSYWHNKYRALFGFYSFALSRGDQRQLEFPTALTHRFCYRRIPVASPRCYQRPEARNVHPHQQACETRTPRSII
jgi:hypothetical protein